MLKQSEDKIIALGKKILVELDSVTTENTLVRWIAHYIAELIQKTATCRDETEKKALQKECCEMVLVLWKNKSILPLQNPIESFKPFIQLLESIDQKKLPFFGKHMLRARKIQKDTNWPGFLNTVKTNSEEIFRESMHFLIDKKPIEIVNKYKEEYSDFLNKDEEKIIKMINNLGNMKGTIPDVNISNKKISEDSFDKIISLLDAQKSAILALKEKWTSEIDG